MVSRRKCLCVIASLCICLSAVQLTLKAGNPKLLTMEVANTQDIGDVSRKAAKLLMPIETNEMPPRNIVVIVDLKFSKDGKFKLMSGTAIFVGIVAWGDLDPDVGFNRRLDSFSRPGSRGKDTGGRPVQDKLDTAFGKYARDQWTRVPTKQSTGSMVFTRSKGSLKEQLVNASDCVEHRGLRVPRFDRVANLTGLQTPAISPVENEVVYVPNLSAADFVVDNESKQPQSLDGTNAADDASPIAGPDSLDKVNHYLVMYRSYESIKDKDGRLVRDKQKNIEHMPYREGCKQVVTMELGRINVSTFFVFTFSHNQISAVR